MVNIIEIKDLTKYYGDIRGIEGLNLKVNQGEVFGYLGPNGAGKTTTIRLMFDLIRPTRGECLIKGYRFYRQKTRRACPLDELRYFLGN